jgi:hypothetical protein
MNPLDVLPSTILSGAEFDAVQASNAKKTEIVNAGMVEDKAKLTADVYAAEDVKDKARLDEIMAMRKDKRGKILDAYNAQRATRVASRSTAAELKPADPAYDWLKPKTTTKTPPPVKATLLS